MLRLKSPFSGAVTTIDVRPANVPEADVAMTIETHGERATYLLSREEVEQLREELHAVVRRVP